MCYICKKGTKGKVHHISCYHVDSIPNEERIRFHSFQEAQLSGREFCKCCSKMYRAMITEKGWLDAFCSENRLRYSYNCSDNSLEIKSRFDQWKLIVKGHSGTVYLYHRSIFGFRKDRKNLIPGYHEQKVWGRSVQKCVEYIAGHDNYRWDLKYAPKAVTAGEEIPVSDAEQEALSAWKEEKIRRIQSVMDLVDQAEAKLPAKKSKGRHKWEKNYVPDRRRAARKTA